MGNQLILFKTDEDYNKARFSKPYFSPLLKIRIAKTVDQNLPRFGFIIPKKVVPKVTDRNRIKRRLKTIALKLSPQLQSFDVLFFPQKTAGQVKFTDLEQQVSRLINQARLWKR
jgi:ribonuclease P protein component